MVDEKKASEAKQVSPASETQNEGEEGDELERAANEAQQAPR